MAEIRTLVPHIRFNLPAKSRKIKGPKGRIDKLRKIVTGLFQYERIEVHQYLSQEVRGCAERLIIEAMRHGDQHPATMEMADHWLEDKNMIHKLFKVLVPRYRSYKSSFTDLHFIPHKYSAAAATEKRAYFFAPVVLELKGNPYPPMPGKPPCNKNSVTNLLLQEAAKDYRRQNFLNKEAEDNVKT